MDKKHVAEWRERSGDKKTRSQVNRPEPSCLVTAHLAHLGVQLQDPHISDTDVSSHKYKGQSLGDWYRMQTLGSAPQYLLLARRDMYHYYHHNNCYRRTRESLLTSDNGHCNWIAGLKHSLESSCPGQWDLLVCSADQGDYCRIKLYNNNLGDCSRMNGTVPLSAELRENVIFFL